MQQDWNDMVNIKKLFFFDFDFDFIQKLFIFRATLTHNGKSNSLNGISIIKINKLGGSRGSMLRNIDSFHNSVSKSVQNVHTFDAFVMKSIVGNS